MIKRTAILGLLLSVQQLSRLVCQYPGLSITMTVNRLTIPIPGRRV